jgi:hypothetical protein
MQPPIVYVLAVIENFTLPGTNPGIDEDVVGSSTQSQISI